MPVATLILHRKRRFDDGAIMEIKLWLLPEPVRGAQHKFKYSLYCGRVGERVIGAWHRAERGEKVSERVFAFESWEGLAAVMTGERYRLLRYLHVDPERSVSALARALGRQYRRVHADVAALQEAGLLERTAGEVRVTADRISADIRL